MTYTKIENLNVPSWPKMYLYCKFRFDTQRIIDKQREEFYNTFKDYFLKNIYLDLVGNTNYAFQLMFDLFEMDNKTMIEYLPKLSKNYPDTKRYCDEKLISLNSLFYNYNEDYVVVKANGWGPCCYNKKCIKNETLDLIINWITESDEFRCDNGMCCINEDFTIDVVQCNFYEDNDKGLTIRVLPIGHKLPDFIQFNKVYGNFRYCNEGWNCTKNYLSGYKGGEVKKHAIFSLKGCPNEVHGNFVVDHIDLECLAGGPKKVTGNYLANSNQLESLDGAPEYVGGKFNLNSNNLTDDAIKECIESHVEYNWKEISIRNNPELIRYRNPKNW